MQTSLLTHSRWTFSSLIDVERQVSDTVKGFCRVERSFFVSDGWQCLTGGPGSQYVTVLYYTAFPVCVRVRARYSTFVPFNAILLSAVGSADDCLPRGVRPTYLSTATQTSGHTVPRWTTCTRRHVLLPFILSCSVIFRSHPDPRDCCITDNDCNNCPVLVLKVNLTHVCVCLWTFTWQTIPIMLLFPAEPINECTKCSNNVVITTIWQI